MKYQPDDIRAANFIACLGPEGMDIIDSFKFDREQDRNDVTILSQKMENHCVGKVSETYERYCFNKRSQQDGETIDAYVATLRMLAKPCNYGDLTDGLIRDRIILGIKDEACRKRLLQTEPLTLDNCVQICKSYESTNRQLKEMSQQDPESVHKVKMQTRGRRPTPSRKDYVLHGEKHVISVAV